MSTKLKRAASAEAAGVSSICVQNMIDEMIKENVALHSLMILRGGEVACEVWREPRTADDVHMAYSVSKSFLSVAFGFAIEEGYLTEETKFLDVFPEYKNKNDKYLEKLTLMHLLSMTAGKRTARGKTHWLDSFVNAKWDFEPGTDFRYVSDNYYAASAALTKLIGMSVTEYLTPRLYEPLGIDVPFWETSPQNIESGGWGLFLKTEDIAKFILCCHNGGVFDGKQVIPAQWISKATSKVCETTSSQTEPDCRAGYGYGFWQCAGIKNTFRCEGMYSQYAISFADYDACIVITSGCAQLQKPLDIIWKYAPDIFAGNRKERVQIEILPVLPFEAKPRSSMEKSINGKVYSLRKRWFIDHIGYPASALTMPVLFFAKEKGGSITDLSFTFDDCGFTMKWTENGGYVNSHYVPLDGTSARGRVVVGEIAADTVAYGVWTDENTLEVMINALAGVADRRFVFTFNGDKISMYPDMSPSMDERSKVIGEKLKCILKGRYFEWWIDFLVPKVKNILQPVHYGKIKN